MNLNALKNFAPAVRRQLIEAVGRKLDFVLTGDTPDLREKAKQRTSIKGKVEKDRPGLIERVAYTWFNRLAALRFLDARGWHPFLCRVLTPASAGETQPEILKLTRNGALPAELAPFADTSRINDLLDGRIPSTDPQGEVYRHLILAACRYYHDLMPFLFEALDDETELLLPDDLLTEHSVAQGFRSAITDDDCAEVEIIGWLYQFYITEKKDQVMARKSAVPTEDIPAVTQLFTPHWIVRYLVENSLGRLWLKSRPDSRLREHMPYYVEDPKGQPLADSLTVAHPEEIRLLDPATGSGHMLTYSFDLLYLIYEEEGHAPSEIPGLIMRHNLFGLEICPRATQLAQFALVCKAREKSRVAFRNPIQPQVICLEDVIFDKDEMNAYLRLPGLHELFTERVALQIHQFRTTAIVGSLLQPVLTEAEITTLKSHLAKVNMGNDLILNETHCKVFRALDQAEMLTQRYHILVANPPYMGGKRMNGLLKVFLQSNYPDGKKDLFAAFIIRSMALVLENGYSGFMAPFVWMFLSSFEKLRTIVLTNFTLMTLVRLSYTAFFESAIVPVCTFVICKKHNQMFKGSFFDLGYLGTAEEQPLRFLEIRNGRGEKSLFYSSTSDFRKIPGSPIAYWLTDKALNVFTESNLLEEIAPPKQGLATTDNDRFLRCWHELSFKNITLECGSRTQALQARGKWFPYNKGGSYRRWYGNNEFVVNWQNDGAEIKANVVRKYPYLNGNPDFVTKNQDSYFKKGITWTYISSSYFGVRYSPAGFIFDVAGSSIFPGENKVFPLLALLSSVVSSYYIKVINPTMNIQAGNVGKLPVKKCCLENEHNLLTATTKLIAMVKEDWDDFETSWDFSSPPILCRQFKSGRLKETYLSLRSLWNEKVGRLQYLEKENNDYFVKAYGLQQELDTSIPVSEITLTCNPHYRYGGSKTEEELEAMLLADTLKEFLSYAVGCMMGRYSLDRPGLVLANLGDTLENYFYHVAKRRRTLDLRTALAEPLSVVLQENASPKCFCCGKINSVSDAWFILADIYDRAEEQICGRPLIYCKDCLKEKEGRISLSRRLCDFTLAEAIDKKWSEPDTLSVFLELAGCFEQRIPAQPEDLTFTPDEDSIIPVLDGEWFEDDIVARTRDFLRLTFGEATLEENIRFIEESLGKDLRKYFLADFYKDHLQIYKKRPIYWLFQSPKKGFSALIYLHRYTRDTVNVLLNRYLRDYMHKLRSRIEHLEHVQATSESTREKTAARKESDALKKTLHECEEYEREIILPLAQQRIELDLDDGVKVNYLKFGKALAPIPGLAAKEEEG